MSRKLRSVISSQDKELVPKIIDRKGIERKIKESQQIQKRQYDRRGIRMLPDSKR